MKNKHFNAEFFRKITKIFFWFSLGALLGLFLFISFTFIIFQRLYQNRVYPGIVVDGIDFGGKRESEVKEFFANKNINIADTQFIFTSDVGNIKIKASDFDYGYNDGLIAKQTISIGRSKNILSNINLVLQAYTNDLRLALSYHYSEEKLLTYLAPTIKSLYIAPVDALFNFSGGKVTTFKASSDGQMVDLNKLKNQIESKFLKVLIYQKPQIITFAIPIKILKPNIATEKVNNLGIKELIGEGRSLFQDSIPGRIHNISIAASKLNGILVKPGEVFSFDKALGDISVFTGYQQAYIIQNGKTVLGDGGGVCQVSTTLFRAILNAGLPVLERHAHAYRVGYYEEDSPPGFDATIYVPTVDLKFKNDTNNYILIQTAIDPNILELKFYLYGTSDQRQVIISKPVITNQTPPPPDLYQDDPTLTKGAIKQADFAASGANVSFTRQVTKNGKAIISEKFVSDFRPWQAVFLRGTKE